MTEEVIYLEVLSSRSSFVSFEPTTLFVYFSVLFLKKSLKLPCIEVEEELGIDSIGSSRCVILT